MIGWKVACEIEGKEVVAEVASHPFALGDDGRYAFLVYHEACLKPVYLKYQQPLLVIEKQ